MPNENPRKKIQEQDNLDNESIEQRKIVKGEMGKEKVLARTQWQLIFRKFKRHKVALVGVWVLIIMYTICVFFPGFFAPYGKFQAFDVTNAPPKKIHFVDDNGHFYLRPFVYNYTKKFDPSNWQTVYKPDKSKKFPLYFLVHGKQYKLLGLFKTDLHFVGTIKNGHIFLFGTDDLGRDLLSRIIYAGRISLSIGFVGVFISIILGLLFGGISGLIGGLVDDIIQRFIEMLISIPKIPLWMGLAAAVPQEWSALKVYFAISIILSCMSWTGLARVIRSKFISLREEDFIQAAKSYNTSQMTIIIKHLIPNFVSYVIVRMTLTIPAMILAETSLSFLGIGLRPPIVSLGVLLNRAQNFQTVAMYPWLLLPGLFVVIAILAFNFVGDGLRDAADPYSK